jgi:radical SAM protein with 4Fe4S-binding SPASM domain
MPWLHMFIHSDGNIYPCCKLAGDETMKLGNVEEDLRQVWNNEKFKQLRLNFKNQNYPSCCYHHCFRNTNPLHVYIDKKHTDNKQHYYDTTGIDGSYEYNLKIYNLNESNLCNHKCLYCSGENSFLLDKNKTVKIAYKNVDKLKKDFLDVIDSLEHIIFAAGESAMQENYIFILRELEKRNLNPKIEFVTNLSKYKFENTNIFSLLNNFNNCFVNASIDSYGDKQEYIRVNSKWETVESNRRELLKYPNIKFVVHSVITNLNAFSLPDFHYNWYNKGFLNKSNLRYITLTAPEQYHLSVMPNHTKDMIIEKYKYYKMFLEDEDDKTVNRAKPIKKVNQILKEINRDPVYDVDLFLKQSLDKSPSFYKIFPEFK